MSLPELELPNPSRLEPGRFRTLFARFSMPFRTIIVSLTNWGDLLSASSQSWDEPPPELGWCWESRRRSEVRWRSPSSPGYPPRPDCWRSPGPVLSLVCGYIQVRTRPPEIFSLSVCWCSKKPSCILNFILPFKWHYLSVLRVGYHGSRSIAVLIVGLLGFLFEVFCSVLHYFSVAVLLITGSGAWDVPGQRVVLYHVLRHVWSENLRNTFCDTQKKYFQF